MPARMIAVGLSLLFSTTAPADSPTTRDNLLRAYEDDVNAEARYRAFAEQADREGYRQAARLFRATAEAERIHAHNHGQALRRLGAEPRAEKRPPSVRGTRWNLSHALAVESGERNRSYPSVIEQARRDGAAEAVISLTMAHGAHDALVKLYQEAIVNAQGMRDARDQLHVCAVCGHVTKGPAPDRCPVSFSPPETYTRVD